MRVFLAGASAVQTPGRLTRRAFLRALASGGAAAFLAACSEGLGASPPTGPSPRPTDRPTAAPTAAAPSSAPSISRPPSAAEPELRTKIGQMLLVGFRGLTIDEASRTVDDIRDRGLGGVVLFDLDGPTGRYERNVASPDQLARLVTDLRAAASIPLLVAIDQEGGKVDRLKAQRGFPDTVSAARLGAHDDVTRTRRAARSIGDTLAELGIDLDLAPVVDVDLNPDNPIIGALDRSFSADPGAVARHGRAFLDGLHDAGVAGCLKHFPGHGSSTADTHLAWVDVTGTWTDRELEPFREIIDAADIVDSVLVAHVFNADLDPIHPASLSPAIIDGMLRGDLGFDGVVITDDLQMGAIRQVYGFETAVEQAIMAGSDILTIAQQQVYEDDVVARTIDIVAAAVDAGRIEAARIDASWRRISALKQRLGWMPGR